MELVLPPMPVLVRQNAEAPPRYIYLSVYCECCGTQGRIDTNPPRTGNPLETIQQPVPLKCHECDGEDTLTVTDRQFACSLRRLHAQNATRSN